MKPADLRTLQLAAAEAGRRIADERCGTGTQSKNHVAISRDALAAIAANAYIEGYEAALRRGEVRP